jgi:tetraacyldisaccharide 4'-kinase
MPVSRGAFWLQSGRLANSAESFHERILGGADRSVFASVLRAGLAAIEPGYAAIMCARNFAYDRGLKKIHRLPLPTLSVGNLTTGGTGKTPVIRWLAERFIQQNFMPAILTRGYRASRTGGSDEQRMLQSYLGSKAHVIANPDRRAGCDVAMRQSPAPQVILLDDGYQHRKIHRDFNLLLISALDPFGHDHVLPRGYLREPVSGLERADAILITRASQVSAAELSALKTRLLKLAPGIPLYESSHVVTHFLHESGPIALGDLPARHVVFSGIATPGQFYSNFPSAVGTQSFPDHHAYTQRDLDALKASATRHHADVLVTTEKDWAKLAHLARVKELPPIYRAQLQNIFAGDDESRLLGQISGLLKLRLLGASPASWARASAT